MAKLKIELKQHTPLIHFQSEQPGAILRATEVKPKLDKFLIEYVFKDDFNKYKEYLIGYKTGKKADKKDEIETPEEKEAERKNEEKKFKDKKAFDYKLRIYVKNTSQIKSVSIKGAMKKLYFASGMDGGKKDGIFTNEDIILEFFTFHQRLIDEIKNNIEKFFCFNNFGTRQNKGFGSFYIKNGPQNQFANAEKWFQNKIKISYKKEYKSEDALWQGMFNKIDTLYKRIRSEEKNGTPYIKEFFRDKGIKWEKDAIRSKFVYEEKESTNDVYLVKDLLGLSVDERWQEKCGTKFRVKKECMAKKEDKIERMESPIFFKPLKGENGDFEIYIKTKDTPKEFFNKTFNITKQIGEKDMGQIELSTLKVPSGENACQVFNMNDFIEFIKANGEIESTSCKDYTNDIKTQSNNKKVNRVNKKNSEVKCMGNIGDRMDPSVIEKLKSI